MKSDYRCYVDGEKDEGGQREPSKGEGPSEGDS